MHSYMAIGQSSDHMIHVLCYTDIIIMVAKYSYVCGFFAMLSDIDTMHVKLNVVTINLFPHDQL